MSDLLTAWAIVVAGGDGARLGADRPKAFVGLGGRALLAESLERLEASPWVDAIVVAAPPGWEEPVVLLAEELVAAKVVASVTGGATRAESVRAALAEVPDDADLIVVHDAARPFASAQLVTRVLSGLADADGAVPGVAVTDTIKRVAGGRVAETPPRASLVAVQTPQAFVASALRRAYAVDAGQLAAATDCASLLEAQGAPVAVVEGDPGNLKITTADDLARAADRC